MRRKRTTTKTTTRKKKQKMMMMKIGGREWRGVIVMGRASTLGSLNSHYRYHSHFDADSSST